MRGLGQIKLYGALPWDVGKLAVDLAGGWGDEWLDVLDSAVDSAAVEWGGDSRVARYEAGSSMELVHHSAWLRTAPQNEGPGGVAPILPPRRSCLHHMELSPPDQPPSKLGFVSFS